MKVRKFGSLAQFKERQILSLVLLAFGLLTLWLLPASKSFGSEASKENACSIVFSTLFRQMQGLHSKDRIVGRSRELTQMEALIEANKNILLTGNSGVGKTSLIELLIREHQQNRLENLRPGDLVFAQFDWRDASLTVRDGSPIDGTSNFTTALNNLVNSSSGKKIVLHIPDFDMFLLELQRRPDFTAMALELKNLMANKKIQIVGELSGRLSKDAFKDSSSPGSALSIEEMIRHDSPFKDFFETLNLAPLSGDQMILAMSLEAARVTKETGISFDANALKAILTLAGNEFNFNASMLKTAKNLLNQIALEKSRSLKSNSNFALSRIQHEIEETKSYIRTLENAYGQEEVLASQKNQLASLEAKRDSALDVARKESSSQAPVAEIRDRIQDLENQIALERDASKILDLKAELRSKKTELEAALQNNENASKPSHITADVVTQWASDLLGREIRFSTKDFDSLLSTRESPSSIRIIENPDVSFADVIGHESAKEIIRRAFDKLNNIDLAIETGTDGPTRIITYGPPGTGKSLFLKASARELDAIYVEMNIADLMTKWQGESEQNIKAFWDEIKRRGLRGERVLISMEEVDSLARDRDAGIGNDTKSTMLNITLTALQDLSDMKMPNIVIIANTNKPWALDSAFTRAGRFDREIYFGLPEVSLREDLLIKSFEKYAARLPENWKDLMKDLSQQMEGWSAAEITEGFSRQVRERIFSELKNLRDSGKPIDAWKISGDKLKEVFQELSESFPGTSKIDLERFFNHRDRNAKKRQELDEAEPGSLSAQE